MTTVVKLGGSLFGFPELGKWLAELKKPRHGGVVVVPGGGPFADQVREAQGRWRFDDKTAHRMAILAMEQYGLMLTGIEPSFVPGRTPEALHAALEEHRRVVWLPGEMLADDRDIEASWQVTSDSLSAWLANRIGAPHLVLVKYDAHPRATVADLQQRGVLDRAFDKFVGGKFAGGARVSVSILGRGDYAAFEKTLRHSRQELC